MTYTIHIEDQELVLHPSGSVYWANSEMLIIADVHLGKVSHFRKHGAAVPASASEANFTNMDSVLAHFQPRAVCFLGDLFHSYMNNDWKRFEKWANACASKLVLVTGNHDIISTHKFEDLGMEVHDELVNAPFLFTHYPVSESGHFNMAGHVHPGVRLGGSGGQRLRLPCFYKSKDSLILPAFGAFTGKHTIRPTKEDQVFAIADGEVLPISH